MVGQRHRGQFVHQLGDADGVRLRQSLQPLMLVVRQTNRQGGHGKTAWRDGTTHRVISPLEFMQRLAALVPRPRLHLIRLVPPQELPQEAPRPNP